MRNDVPSPVAYWHKLAANVLAEGHSFLNSVIEIPPNLRSYRTDRHGAAPGFQVRSASPLLPKSTRTCLIVALVGQSKQLAAVQALS